jgi:hypothetical protein
MRIGTAIFAFLVVVGSTACTPAQRDSAAREAGREAHEAKEAADSAAKKAGRVAHEVAEDSKEAAKKAGAAVSKAAKEAKEGWNEAARESKEKK